jgi:FMN-dependent NADH-azoreductase
VVAPSGLKPSEPSQNPGDFHLQTRELQSLPDCIAVGGHFCLLERLALDWMIIVSFLPSQRDEECPECPSGAQNIQDWAPLIPVHIDIEMKRILIIESSPRGAESASRQLTETLRERLRSLHPNASFVERDLATDTLPHLDYQTVKGISTKDKIEAESLKGALRLSDELSEELLSCDLLVVASPMWNFGLPSSLKAWIDHIVRAGKTFNYAGAGVEGLAKGKKAILVLASGGVSRKGRGSRGTPWNPIFA